KPDAALLHERFPDNAFIHATVSEGDIAAVAAAAPVSIQRTFRMNRQATVALEGRGALAYWDHRLDELVVYIYTQGAHVMRIGLAMALGLREHKLRVIAPDVGGGFGGKNRLMPEEVAVCAIALKTGKPAR